MKLRRREGFDLSGKVGAAIILGFAGIAAFRFAESGLLFFALFALRDSVAGMLLAVRRRDLHGEQRLGHAGLAYLSSALPLFYLAGSTNIADTVQVASRIFVIVGFALATVALLELGRSFGVAPANRGVVKSGVYSFLRHPIYLGYGIAEFGMALLNPVNAPMFLISVAAYRLRARAEHEVLALASN